MKVTYPKYGWCESRYGDVYDRVFARRIMNDMAARMKEVEKMVKQDEKKKAEAEAKKKK